MNGKRVMILASAMSLGLAVAACTPEELSAAQQYVGGVCTAAAIGSTIAVEVLADVSAAAPAAPIVTTVVKTSSDVCNGLVQSLAGLNVVQAKAVRMTVKAPNGRTTLRRTVILKRPTS